VERFRATGNDQDLLAYPIVSIQTPRRAVPEGSLAGPGAVHGSRADPADEQHRLMDLWTACRRLHEQVWPDDGGDLDAVEGTIIELARVDPKSQVFRYPEDRHGRPHLPPEAETFDLLHFADEMTKLSHWFDGVDGMLDSYSGYKQDMDEHQRQMEAEYLAEMAAEARSW